jgi:uncharacterized protein (DUF1800 family)
MQITTRNKIFLSALAVLAPAGVVSAMKPLAAAPTDPGKPAPPAAKKGVAPKRTLTEDEKIVHVLNRLGYGARPGDVEKVRAIGLQKYIALQLTPERIDDSAVDKRLATFTQLQQSDAEITALYHDFLLADRNTRNKNKQNKKQAQAGMPAATDTAEGSALTVQKRPILDMAERQALREARQEQAKAAMPIAQIHAQFMAAKMLRATESERQLQEVMADFWSNHFNIDMRRSPCGILKIADDRDVIRPHVFSKFRDLLGASAKSPAMLVYLDNYLSTVDPADMPAEAGPVIRARAKRRKMPLGGLNENYGRELMELHTLGVDGGYTQKDVREVARCFTGWSMAAGDTNRPARGRYQEPGAFRFFPALHDNGQKTVLGQLLPAGGGMKDGERVLDILASHPATMRHISTLLCQRLVSDTPPATLIDKCIATWKRTDGDLREVVRTIATAPEFTAPAAIRSKIKSPFEYAVSSVRALGGDYQAEQIAQARPAPREAAYLIRPPKGGGYLDMSETTLVGQVGTMGQPLFQYQAPTGYPEDSRKWVSAGALISRLNFSLALTNGKLSDVSGFKIAPGAIPAKDVNQLLDQLSAQVLHSPIAPTTRATLLKQLGPQVVTASMDSGSSTANRIAALLLGSPEFQRR